MLKHLVHNACHVGIILVQRWEGLLAKTVHARSNTPGTVRANPDYLHKSDEAIWSLQNQGQVERTRCVRDLRRIQYFAPSTPGG